jgi:hypothetical protein
MDDGGCRRCNRCGTAGRARPCPNDRPTDSTHLVGREHGKRRDRRECGDRHPRRQVVDGRRTAEVDRDYPFTFVDIRLNKDGEGEGKMAVATQLQFDKKKNTIVFENYSTEPVRLQQVKVVKAG